MIVIMHSQRAGMDIPGWFLSGSSFITGAGLVLFFMISGALTLNKATNQTQFNTFTFLKHRITKIAIPLFFWLIAYTLLASINGSGVGVLWFLWTISGLYLLSPIMIRWLSLAPIKEVELYLTIWLVSLLYPLIKLVWPLNEGDTSWVYYFHGYVGYYVLGYYLSVVSKERLRQYKRVFYTAFFLFTICAPCIILFTGIKVNFYSLFWYLTLPCALQSILWFVTFRNLEDKISKWSNTIVSTISSLSSMTFGIYLSHILMLRIILWNIDALSQIKGIPYMIITSTLAFLMSLCLTYCLKKIPYIGKVVGL